MFTAIQGIGIKTAKKLYEEGFKDIKSLSNTSDERLLQVRGIGQNSLTKIRDYRQNE